MQPQSGQAVRDRTVWYDQCLGQVQVRGVACSFCAQGGAGNPCLWLACDLDSTAPSDVEETARVDGVWELQVHSHLVIPDLGIEYVPLRKHAAGDDTADEKDPASIG